MTFKYLSSRKMSTSSIIWQSVVVSYILKAMCITLHQFVFTSVTFILGVRVIIISIVAVCLALLLVYLVDIKRIIEKIPFINYKSIHDDVWIDIIDYENGTTLRCVCNDGTVYTGKLFAHEENGIDSWFVLYDYIVEENDNDYDYEKTGYPSMLSVNIRNVKRVELYYSKDTKVI